MRTPDRTILQLSDPHLERVETDADGRLARALEAVRASGVRPDALLLSGDLADDGSDEAYARLRALVAPVAAELGSPVVALPGNHDLTDPFRAALLDGGPVDRVEWLGGLRVVVLDTNVPGAAHGVLRDEQLAWLAEQLAEPASEGTLLALHHPPIPTPHPLMIRLALRRPERLADVVRGTDVRQIVCGHAHAAAAGTLAGIPVWSAPALTVTMDPVSPAGRLRAWADLGGITRLDLFGRDWIATHVPVSADATVLYDDPIAERTAWLDAAEAQERGD